MKCLSLTETQKWCSTFNVGIDQNRNLSFLNELKSVMAVIPKTSGSLMSFSTQLTEWLPRHFTRMLYLSSWETYPPNKNIIYENLRSSCGETRHIIDAPGHLFDALPDGNIYEIDEITRLSNDPIVQENAMMSGLTFLALSFNWQGYLLCEGHSDHIYLGDEFIIFKSKTDQKLDSARGVLAQFKLRIISRMEDAWT